jgi:hypothetical protein
MAIAMRSETMIHKQNEARGEGSGLDLQKRCDEATIA